MVVIFPKDASKLVLLLVLYIIQAVPLGLSAAVPLLLQSRGVGYSELAIYSCASLPFSLKLLWAPIVDSTRIPPLGRRKSWLLPTQALCGLMMLTFGSMGMVSTWIGENGEVPRVIPLCIFFGILYICMATQDIAVDGWALELLPEERKKHASTCNTIGQSLGFYVSNVSLLLFNDPDTCNSYFRRTPQPFGMLSMSGFLSFWGIVFLVVTTYVMLFQPEAPPPRHNYGASREDSSLRIKDSYTLLGHLAFIKPVRVACLVLLTSRIAFAATDSIGMLKMVEVGIKKETLALFSPFVVPWGVLSSYITGRMIGPRSALSIFKCGWRLRASMVLVWLGVFYVTKYIYQPFDGHLHSLPARIVYWLGIYLCISAQQMFTEFMFVSQMAFFAQVSDTSIGGSSMTFFNTMANLGNKWPGLVVLASVDMVGRMIGFVDPFVTLSLGCLTLGLAWLHIIGNGALSRLEHTAPNDWVLVPLGPGKKDLLKKRTAEMAEMASSESFGGNDNQPNRRTIMSEK